MAENKKSFLLYCDTKKTVDMLSNEKAGKLFKHILSYVNDEEPETTDIIIKLAFEPIKLQLKRDLKKYERICERNRSNGANGGRPKDETKNPEEPKKPSGLSGNPEEPDNDTDTDTDTDILPIVNFPENSPSGDDFLKSLSKKTGKSVAVIGIAQVKFETFRIAYPGKKDGPDVAFLQFVEGKNTLADIELLLPALEKEKVYMAQFPDRNWKNLKTWIHDKCWTQVLPETVKPPGQKLFTYKQIQDKCTPEYKAFEHYLKLGPDKYIEIKSKVSCQ